jgi:hypothetical protein
MKRTLLVMPGPCAGHPRLAFLAIVSRKTLMAGTTLAAGASAARPAMTEVVIPSAGR